MDIYKKMRNLIKKILREEEDFQWMKDIRPNFFHVLEVITKDDPLINVAYNEDEDVYEIRDDVGYSYYDDYDLEQFLDRQYSEYRFNLDPHNIKETKKILLDYIEDVVNYMDSSDKDYNDFMHLYQVISDNF